MFSFYFYDPNKLSRDEKDSAFEWIEKLEIVAKDKFSKDQKDLLASGFYAGLQYQKNRSAKNE